MTARPDRGTDTRPGRDPIAAGSDERAFEALLADAQPRIRGYLASILGGWADVDDLVQETNLVLVRKQAEFREGSNFLAWAFRIAFFKATTWRRDRSREGRVVLHENDFQRVAAEAEGYFTAEPAALPALRKCVGRLRPEERSLIHAKYVERLSLTDLAARLGCAANTLHKRISRVREALRRCVRQRLDGI